jgi:hypothetical protein
MKAVKVKKVHTPHWYRMHVGECPVCGRDKSFKERVYGKKPKSARKRYVYLPASETYDWCDAY